MSQEVTSVGVHLTPESEITGDEFESGGVHVASIRVGGFVTIYASAREHGDAAIIAVYGALRDICDDHIASARERLRVAIGQQALPDALEPASMAEATATWADSWTAEIAARPPFLPDVPLAAISESELRALDGDR